MRLGKEEAGTEGFVGFGAFSPRPLLECRHRRPQRVGRKAARDCLDDFPAGRRPDRKFDGKHTPASPKSVDDLEKQAEDLETRAKNLRKQIHALKPPAK